MGGCLHPMIFLDPHSPSLKNKTPFLEMISRKKKQIKLETAINTCVSLKKQQWEKMAEIPKKRDFLT